MVRGSGEPADIQDEVLALLKSHNESEGFLEPPSLLEPGAEVGAYRIDRILGRGGMGVVYLAYDTRLHRPVALKSLPPHLFRDDRMHARLRKEARAAAALSHPSIATVYALEEIGGQLFIATEYVEGVTLREEIDSGGFSHDNERVIAVGLRIAEALRAAHERGIVHRDLKPENILLNAGGLKIVDFGLAQFDLSAQERLSVTRLTDAGTLAGTPPYMAPEQLLGKPTDHRTDQFAFGVVLYELMTGQHPFGNGPLPTTIARILGDELDPASSIPVAVWKVIVRATQKKPDDRYASTTDVIAELSEAVNGKHVASPRQEVHEAPARGADPGAKNWWGRHQAIVAFSYWLMIWPAWHVHRWLGTYGVLIFLGTLASVIVGGNLRLHLWFTSRTYPSELAEQRAHVAQWVRAADILFTVIMLATGLGIAGDHTGWGALFISFGIGAALAFLIIEPTTARAAFKRDRA
jgi:tRNA A-37 threonylcarbamoyl transferase component Bud32